MHLKIEDYICFSVLVIPEFEHELWLTTNGSDKGQATGCGTILAAVRKITEEKLHGEKKGLVSHCRGSGILSTHFIGTRVRCTYKPMHAHLPSRTTETTQHGITRWIDAWAEYNFCIKPLACNKKCRC